MIRYTLYQNQSTMNEKAYGKYYPRVKVDETFDLDMLSDHMSSHNTPYSKGCIKGILTDAVACIKELLMDGKNVKIDNLAIFSVGIKTKQGAESPEKYSTAANISGVKLRARATGKLCTSQMNLEATIVKA